MWQPYEFPPNDPRAGILSQVSFVALHSPPGRSSPTLRGKALREIMLCQRVPAPPGNVEFKIVQDTNNPEYKTARARLDVHRTNPVCAGCHKLIDPMGLALENFDGDGAYRTSENGAKIDASGALDGVTFTDAVGLGKAMHDNPATRRPRRAAAAWCLTALAARRRRRAEAPWVDDPDQEGLREERLPRPRPDARDRRQPRILSVSCRCRLPKGSTGSVRQHRIKVTSMHRDYEREIIPRLPSESILAGGHSSGQRRTLIMAD